jgi:FimV-like protein
VSLRKLTCINQQSLELFRAVGDRYGIGISLLNLGRDASKSQNLAREIALYHESLYLFRELGNKDMVSHLLNNLADAYRDLGDLEKAREVLEENLRNLNSSGNQELMSQAQLTLGDVFYTRGEDEQAYRHYQECLERCRKTKDHWALMRVLNALARWHRDHNAVKLAQSLVEEGIHLAQTAGDQQMLTTLFETKATLEAVVGSPATAT